MKCNKCGCLVNGYYHSYKYNDLDYCHHCMLETLVDLGIIKRISYNEEYKRFLEYLNSYWINKEWNIYELYGWNGML